MVNKVPTIYTENNPFKEFALIPNEARISGAPIPKQKPDSVEITEKVPHKHRHKKRNIALGIGGTALLTGLAILTLGKGMPKGTGKFLETVKKFLENRLEKAKLTGSHGWSEIYIYSIRKVEAFMSKTASINNYTSVKDVSFKTLMGKTKITRGIHNKITNLFERIARSTVTGSYKGTQKKFDKMFKSFDNLDDLILKNNPDELITIAGKARTKKEWVEIAGSHCQNVKSSLTEFMSEESLANRYKYIKGVTSKLYEQFWNSSFKDFWSKDNKFLKKEMWQTFIADEHIAAGRTALSESVAQVRNKISYSSQDRNRLIAEQISILEKYVAPSDKEGFNIIKKLNWFLKNPEGVNSNKEVFIKELENILKRPLQQGLDAAIVKNQQACKNSTVQAIKNLLSSRNTGELQEMLNIYEKIAPYELSLVKPSVNKAVSSFDKSLKTETIDFFEKVRDLSLGSAPTDILSILGFTGAIGYGLTTAKNKDERISLLIKSGVPIFATLGTMSLCTARLISGSKALLLGLSTGAVIKQICNAIDNYRLKKSQNPPNNEVAFR